MKITDVKTFPICHGSRNYLFVKVETDDGLYGVGEFGITWKEQAGIGAIEHMKRHIIGSGPAQYRIHLATVVPRRFLSRWSDQRGCHVGH